MDPSGGAERADCRLSSDCLNVFKLIDVGSVRWRRYALTAALASPKDDPVLVSWNKLLAAGFAAWFQGHEATSIGVEPPVASPPRPRSTPQPAESVASPETLWRRQLWVFWTASDDAMDVDNLLVASEMEETDSGDWTTTMKPQVNGSSNSVCRKAMLAAYHCLIARELTDGHFASLGRWFVKPQLESVVRNVAMSAINRDSVLLSFSLFIHGDRWLCAAVDMRLCPALGVLNRSHLTQLRQQPTEALKVLLSPSGLSGTLRSHSRAAAGPAVGTAALKEWLTFYPILGRTAPATGRRDGGGDLPALVEVDVQGVRMLYPSALVLVPNRRKTLTALAMVPGAGKGRQGKVNSGGGLRTSLSAGVSSSSLSVGDLLEEMTKLSWDLSASTPTSSQQSGSVSAKGFFPYVGGSLGKDPCSCGKTKSQSKNGSSSKSRGSHLKDSQSSSTLNFHKKADLPFHHRRAVRDEMTTEILLPGEFGPSTTSVIKHERLLASSSVKISASRATSVKADSPLPSPFLGRSLVAATASFQSPNPNGVHVDPKAFNFDPSAPSRPKGVGTGTPAVKLLQPSDSSLALLPSKGIVRPHSGERGPEKEAEYRPKTTIDVLSVWRCYQLPPPGNDWAPPRLPDNVGNFSDEDETENGMIVTEAGSSGRKRPQSESGPIAKKLAIDLSGDAEGDGKRTSPPSGEDTVVALTPTLTVRKSTSKKIGTRSRRPSKAKKTERSSRTASEKESARKGSFSTPAVPTATTSPLSPEPSPIDDVFAVDHETPSTATSTADALISSSTGKQSSSLAFCQEKDLDIVGNELDNLFDSDCDEDSIRNPFGTTPRVDPGKSSKSSGVLLGSKLGQDLVAMDHACFPTPPSSLEQPSPATTDENYAAKGQQEQQQQKLRPTGNGGAFHVRTCEDGIMEESKFPVEMVKLMEECVISCLFSPIELPSRKLLPLLKSHSHLMYISSTQIIQEEEAKALNRVDPQFMKELTPTPSIPLIGPAHTPLPDSKQIIPSTIFGAGSGSKHPPAASTIARCQRASLVNSVSSPGSHCSTPLPISEGNALSALQSAAIGGGAGGLPRHSGSLYPHSLLVSLLASSQVHMLCDPGDLNAEEQAIRYHPVQSHVAATPSGKSHLFSVPWPSARQSSDGFDVPSSHFHHRHLCQNVPAISDLIELTQRHCLASATFGLKWKCAKSVAKSLSTQSLTPLNDILNGKMINRCLYFGRELGDCLSSSRHIPFSNFTGGSRAAEEDGSLLMTVFVKGKAELYNREWRNVKSLLKCKSTSALNEASNELLSIEEFQKLADPNDLSELESLPVPAVQVGYDGEVVSVSPAALANWEKLQLEPYSNVHNVVYLAVAPEPLNGVRSFIKQLSQVYEDCRLGKHTPCAKMREGIVKVGKKYAERPSTASAEEGSWFSRQGTSPFAQQWQCLARACRSAVVPLVSSTVSEAYGVLTGSGASSDSDQASFPARFTVVVYLFVSGLSGTSSSKASSSAGLPSNQECILRCFQEIVEALPVYARSYVVLQAVPLDSTFHQYRQLSSDSSASAGWPLRSLALSVYCQCRPSFQLPSHGKMLTSFGSVSWKKNLVQNTLPHVFSPAFVLEQPDNALMSEPAIYKNATGKNDDVDDATNSNWLLCGYTWIEEGRLLVGVLTDGQGSILEPTVIAMPKCSEEKENSGHLPFLSVLKDLYSFCCDFVSHSRLEFHVVFSRLGPLSQAESQAWNQILNQKRLLAMNQKLADCGIAKQLPSTYKHATILSVSVVNLEFEEELQVLSVPGKKSSSTLVVFSSDFDAKKISTFKELSSETIPLLSGNVNLDNFETSATTAAAATLDNLNFDVSGTDNQNDLVILSEIRPLSKRGDEGGRNSTSSGLDTFLLNSPPPPPSSEPGSAARMSDFRPVSLSANTPTEAQDFLLGEVEPGMEKEVEMASSSAGGRENGRGKAGIQEAGGQGSTFCEAFLFLSLGEIDKEESASSVIKGSMSLCCHATPLSYQQHLRLIMRRYDALSWLGMDLATGQRLSGLPFQLSAAEALAGEVDAVSQLGNE
eukprot:m.118515 g.118515  ORF g.118515 m.118515 type:complete len:2039 (+) comp37645_c0_seq3:48-6164(+)